MQIFFFKIQKKVIDSCSKKTICSQNKTHYQATFSPKMDILAILNDNLGLFRTRDSFG